MARLTSQSAMWLAGARPAIIATISRALNSMTQAATCIARPISSSWAARTRPQPRLPGGVARLKTTRQSSFGKLLSVIWLSGSAIERKR
jgi:hypothetical protein